MNPVVAVIGFGNVIRGDDAIGIIVVDSVRELLEGVSDPRLRLGEITLTTASALDIARAEEYVHSSAIILVDAWEGGQGVLVQEVQTMTRAHTLTSHLSSPEALASLMEALHARRPKILLVAVAGKDFGLKQGISAEAKTSSRNAVNVVMDLIDSLLPPE